MIRELQKQEIRKFVDFGDELYRNDPNYVPFMRRDLIRSIRSLVFEKRSYRALCSFDEQGRMNGRILLTVNANKQLHTEHCGYFSHFECVNDQKVFDGLMAAAGQLLRGQGAEYLVGSFFHHDPDNRRGILAEGFEEPPVLFTSYNPPYYRVLFETGGFSKLTDANEYEYRGNEETMQRIRAVGEQALRENGLHITHLDLRRLDREAEDVRRVMEAASTQVNFENVLSTEEIRRLIGSWKRYLNTDYALIVRKNSDNSPVGFTLAMPDYFELIRKARGRLNLRGMWIFLFGRKKVRSVRAMLQYILPEYQHKGVSKALYWENYKAVRKNGVTRISLGTIMEKNRDSNGAIRSLGGELSRVYRIYYRSLKD